MIILQQPSYLIFAREMRTHLEHGLVCWRSSFAYACYLLWIECVPLDLYGCARSRSQATQYHRRTRECILHHESFPSAPTLQSITHLLLTRSPKCPSCINPLRSSLLRQPTSARFSPKSAWRVGLHSVITHAVLVTRAGGLRYDPRWVERFVHWL